MPSSLTPLGPVGIKLNQALPHLLLYLEPLPSLCLESPSLPLGLALLHSALQAQAEPRLP